MRRHGSFTDNPSKYQGFMREKSVSCDAFGSWLTWAITNYKRFRSGVELREMKYLNMIPILHCKRIHLINNKEFNGAQIVAISDNYVRDEQ